MSAVVRVIDRISDAIGRLVAWAALLIILLQFAVVVLRYIFGVGSLVLQESVLYLHSALFLLGAGYTLLHDGHVRVDILYRTASRRRRAAVDLAGALLLLLPVCALVWWISWPYVAISWAVLEGSRETSGIPAVFLLKTLILAFAVLLALQGIALALRSALALGGASTRPEKDHGPAAEAP